jgi:hypothetical protein
MLFRGPDRINHLGIRQRRASLCGLQAFVRQAPQVPTSSPTSRTLPERAGGAQGALPRRYPTAANRENLTGKTNGWKHILNALTIHYGDRINNINH